jgi:hypothetical protein
MYRQTLLAGLALWVIGTAAFRFGPSGLVHAPSLARTLPFYLANAALALVVARLAMRWIGVPPSVRPAAVSLFILPTLLLDSFATAFFPAVYPNLPVAGAPTFGGLMLISAGGAVVGAWLP